MNDLLYYGLMQQEQTNDALVQFNARWKLLVGIHNDLNERFIDRVTDQLNDDDRAVMMPYIKNIMRWQKYIFDNIETVDAGYLSQYAGGLKVTTMQAIRLCKKYKIYNDIESFRFNSKTQMLELNGEDLYFLGETNRA